MRAQADDFETAMQMGNDVKTTRADGACRAQHDHAPASGDSIGRGGGEGHATPARKALILARAGRVSQRVLPQNTRNTEKKERGGTPDCNLVSCLSWFISCSRRPASRA